MYVRFKSREQPIVGTSFEYFDFRGLTLSAGRMPALLGECVLGAGAAEALGVGVGDSVVSSPETAFDLAGIYPLKMNVVGVLAPNFTSDDNAIFVDVKTTWIIEGLGHGHQDLADSEASAAVLNRTEDNIVANASLVQFNEITDDNIDSFHFHGSLDDYPLTGVIAVPKDEKSGVILMGRYLDSDADNQIVRPRDVVEELLDTILTIQQFIVAAVFIVAVATIATASLVFLLSLRLRRREIDTIGKIGGGRWHVASMLLAEVVIVLVLGSMLAAGLTALTWRYGSAIIESVVMS
jgi:putative ABC transport system permease protein